MRKTLSFVIAAVAFIGGLFLHAQTPSAKSQDKRRVPGQDAKGNPLRLAK